MGADGASGGDYAPPEEFQVYSKDSLLKPKKFTDDVELFLFQWPANQLPDFDGQELSLELHPGGSLGSFTGSSGEKYEITSTSQAPDSKVFLSYGSESKIVGKISRCVTIVNYPEPGNLDILKKKTGSKQLYLKSAGTMTNTSNLFSTPTQSTKLRYSQSRSVLKASTHSSRHKNSLSEFGEQSKRRKHVREQTLTMGQHTQDSGRTHSAVTSGSKQHSHEGETVKKVKRDVR